MHRFVSPGPFEVGHHVCLDPVQSHHAAKVLRLAAGDVVLLLDGRGLVGEAVLEEVRPRQVLVKVQQVSSRTERSRVQLCFSVPKGQALDFVLRRAAELGLAGFQPLKTRYSSPVKGWNSTRWTQVVAEVCKQCEDAHFPYVQDPVPLETWLSCRDSTRTLVLCDENARFENLGGSVPGEVDLVIGPEGGFSPEEVDRLLQAGAFRMGLGRNRLRAGTASVVALALLKRAIGEI